MFSGARKRFTYANVAMTLALVFAFSGGAFAAGKFLITSTKQISPKVLKQLKGARGPAGQQGAAGPAGPAGGPGKDGLAGKNGENGKDGAPGAPGKDGKEGSPWTAGGTLPSGKSLKGEWSVDAQHTEATRVVRSSVSYALPLSKAPITHYIAHNATLPTGCKGSVESPEADPGNLCVFGNEEINSLKELVIPQVLERYYPGICKWESAKIEEECTTTKGGEGEGSLYGFGVSAVAESEGEVLVEGTWAVTAE